MVIDIKCMMTLFVNGISRFPREEGKAVVFIRDMDITRVMDLCAICL